MRITDEGIAFKPMFTAQNCMYIQGVGGDRLRKSIRCISGHRPDSMWYVPCNSDEANEERGTRENDGVMNEGQSLNKMGRRTHVLDSDGKEEKYPESLFPEDLPLSVTRNARNLNSPVARGKLSGRPVCHFGSKHQRKRIRYQRDEEYHDAKRFYFAPSNKPIDTLGGQQEHNSKQRDRRKIHPQA